MALVMAGWRLVRCSQLLNGGRSFLPPIRVVDLRYGFAAPSGSSTPSYPSP